MEITLMDMLEARERRAAKQEACLLRFGKTLVCFTMNIAGPVKDSPLLRRGFAQGLRILEGQLAMAGIRSLYREEVREATGCEAFLVLDADPLSVKRVTSEIEDNTPAGRLYDMDVLCPDGRKVDRQELGLPGRTCLLCGAPAQVCARSRAHRVPELQEKTTRLLTDALRQEDCATVARLACQALLYEVATTPKPGLVDRVNRGSHRDMDFFSFQASAAALWPYFFRCAEIGMDTREAPPEQTLGKLRFPGKLAEQAMLRATGGVNTHKGAIFSLGILCGSLGRLDRALWGDPRRVLDECAAMAKGIVSRDYRDLTPQTAVTTGQRLYLEHGICGVRGQAEAGFPAVREVGLPKLEEGLARGRSLEQAGCAALLAMLAETEDTNLIHRGGLDAQREISGRLSDLLVKEPFPSRETLEALDQEFIRANLSPGGTADLLAMAYMLHFLKGEPHV